MLCEGENYVEACREPALLEFLMSHVLRSDGSPLEGVADVSDVRLPGCLLQVVGWDGGKITCGINGSLRRYGNLRFAD